MSNDKNLLIFNLKTDADDNVLGFTTDWINELAKHFRRVFVITMSAGRTVVADNVQVFSIGKEKGYSEPRRVLEFYFLLYRVLRSEKIDACFAHMMPLFVVMGWLLLKKKGIPIVLWHAHKSVNPLLRIAVRLVDCVITSSKSGFQLNTHKLCVIGQGIDTDRFCPSPVDNSANSPFTILTVGRLSPIKRVEILIEALAMLRLRKPELDVQVKIVGGPACPADQKYIESLKTMAKNTDIAEQVEFIGNKAFSEIHRVYQIADCFINLSDTDSVDKAVLEAMSCEIPVITSNSAFLEVLEPHVLSQWVINKGSITALYEHIVTLLSMPVFERKTLGYRLRQIVVNEHSLHMLGTRISDEINRLTGNQA